MSCSSGDVLTVSVCRFHKPFISGRSHMTVTKELTAHRSFSTTTGRLSGLSSNPCTLPANMKSDENVFHGGFRRSRVKILGNALTKSTSRFVLNSGTFPHTRCDSGRWELRGEGRAPDPVARCSLSQLQDSDGETGGGLETSTEVISLPAPRGQHT